MTATTCGGSLLGLFFVVFACRQRAEDNEIFRIIGVRVAASYGMGADGGGGSSVRA